MKLLIKEAGVKTCHSDPVPASILNVIIDNLLPYITQLINKSLETGLIEGIKESVIKSLLKKQDLDSETFNNYRPVANLTFISKLVEKAVLSRLNKHMNLHNLHCPSQHGYKKHHSTETLLLELIDDILVGFERNSATIVLLIDLSAAFDTIDTGRLLKILHHEIGISGVALNWFKSYLTKRKQKVKIGNCTSSSCDVEFGVPQGSVLGPVLFNVYIRSLSAVFNALRFKSLG